MSKRSKKNKKSSKKTYIKKTNTPLPVINRKLLIGFIIGAFTLISYINDIETFFTNHFKSKPIEKISESNIELINNLKELNSKYDLDRSQKHIDQMVEILVYNFETLKKINPESYKINTQNMQFFNSANINSPGNLLAFNGLTLMQINYNKGKINAVFDARIKNPNAPTEINSLPFHFWWENQKVLDDRHGNIFTRKNLILSYALYVKQGNYKDVEGIQNVKEFNFLNIGFGSGVQLLTNKITNQAPLPKEILNNMLFECIRAISGEYTQTLINNNLKI